MTLYATARSASAAAQGSRDRVPGYDTVTSAAQSCRRMHTADSDIVTMLASNPPIVTENLLRKLQANVSC